MTTLSKFYEVAQQNINDLAEQEDYSVTLRNDYSGRGMFGRRCVGIICPRHLVMEAIDCLKQAQQETGVKLPVNLNRDFCKDNMGLDMIYYYPQLDISTDGESDNI